LGTASGALPPQPVGLRSPCCLDAFSSGEPKTTSLENAIEGFDAFPCHRFS
jgi:hypothetical protein